MPQGGNTGPCGGATPFDRPGRREILLSTAGELARYESAEAVALVRTLKRALDPHGIMNPGKVLAP